MEGWQIDPSDRFAIVRVRMAAYEDDATGERLIRSVGRRSRPAGVLSAIRAWVLRLRAAVAVDCDELATLEAHR